jgi:uncharacterized membrane protein
MFLCSRWGKSEYEIGEMPIREFNRHKLFWQHYRWGMNDDLHAMHLARISNSKDRKFEPWAIKDMTVLKGYTYRMIKIVRQPVSSIRAGFMAIASAIKGIGKRGR